MQIWIYNSAGSKLNFQKTEATVYTACILQTPLKGSWSQNKAGRRVAVPYVLLWEMGVCGAMGWFHFHKFSVIFAGVKVVQKYQFLKWKTMDAKGVDLYSKVHKFHTF